MVKTESAPRTEQFTTTLIWAEKQIIAIIKYADGSTGTGSADTMEQAISNAYWSTLTKEETNG